MKLINQKGQGNCWMRLWQRVRNEWRMGMPVLLGNHLVAAAETLDADSWQIIQANSPALQLIITGERASRVLDNAAKVPVAFALPDQMRLDDVLGAIDPTISAAQPDWRSYVTPPLLLPKQLDAMVAQIKRAGLLPAFIVGALHNDQLRFWQDQDVMQLARENIVFPEEPLDLAALPRINLPLTETEDVQAIAFRDRELGLDHLALIIGTPGPVPLVRVHSSCLTGDVLGSLRCDCGPQLQNAIRRMRDEGGGILLYLSQEGRGIGLGNKLRAYHLQEQGLDTVDANLALGFGMDERSFALAASILKEMDIKSIRLMTNNPAKAEQLKSYGIEVTERLPHQFGKGIHNTAYLETKKTRAGHLF